MSDAEVGRRAGLSERRYGYYATGEREPNLETLVRICEVLLATPNEMLLADSKPKEPTVRERTIARIRAATHDLSLADLELAACQIECPGTHRNRRRGQRVRPDGA
ncbi:MAG: helix-turn-helix domain-containing protein [Stellaceae bacterium]